MNNVIKMLTLSLVTGVFFMISADTRADGIPENAAEDIETGCAKSCQSVFIECRAELKPSGHHKHSVSSCVKKSGECRRKCREK